MIEVMQKVESDFRAAERKLIDLSSFVCLHIPEVEFFKKITIPIRFKSPSRCFDHMISWSYSLIFESLVKQYDFILKQARNLNFAISSEITEFKSCVHYHRTYQQHSLFDNDRNQDFKDYVEAWFQEICEKSEPSSDEQWIHCLQKFLSDLVEVVNCLEQTIRESMASEFRHIFIYEWSKLSARTYEKHEYDAVLQDVLENHGLNKFISNVQFTNKYLNEWQRSVAILPDGFDFKIAAYSIIEKTVINTNEIPINGQDLIDRGIPQGTDLGKCLTEARRKFKESPCNGEELVIYVSNWYSVTKTETT